MLWNHMANNPRVAGSNPVTALRRHKAQWQSSDVSQIFVAAFYLG